MAEHSVRAPQPGPKPLQGAIGPDAQRLEAIERRSAGREGRHEALLERRPAGPSAVQRSRDPGPGALLEARPPGPQPRQAANRTGLPDRLKSGVEALSGLSLDGVIVHYNSPRPAQLSALAYAQGTEIHLGPGQERHLPHEAWHVVQQAQGRVRPTMQMRNRVPVGDDEGLEREADAMGARALAASGTNPLAAPTLAPLPVGKPHGAPVQRKGVKSELVAADANIEALATESQKSRSLMNTVGDAIYEAYKPANQGQGPISQGWDTKNRDKSKGRLDEAVALEGVRRLNGWAKTANEAALRILSELTGIADVANIDLATIKMGSNTDQDPDAFATLKSGVEVALESKYVTSPAQGAVDGHVVAASSQLQKRFDYQKNKITKTKFAKFIAYITVLEPSNPWPYTPASYKKSQPTGFKDLPQVMTDRLQKYKGKSIATIGITYVVTLNGTKHEVTIK
jgi:hypothetical protein